MNTKRILKKSKYSFTLVGVNTNRINTRYGIENTPSSSNDDKASGTLSAKANNTE
jgi:hypothetical protein